MDLNRSRGFVGTPKFPASIPKNKEATLRWLKPRLACRPGKNTDIAENLALAQSSAVICGRWY
jgi:hypothetical protein